MRGLGNDIIEIKRLGDAIQRHGQRFLDELFTPQEQTYCLKHAQAARHFAGRFAAKEAIAKALGVGISAGLNWLDMEILNDSQGKPILHCSERLNQLFGSPTIHLSISHCKEYATAVAIWV